MVALIKCLAVLRAPAGKRLAPMLPVLVPILRRDGGEIQLSAISLDLTGTEADQLCKMNAATIDRRLAGERAKMIEPPWACRRVWLGHSGLSVVVA